MTISPDNKLTIAKVPFYCQLMEWGKFPIYLTLECINTFFAIIWFRHSDEYQWETIGYVIQTTARRKTLLFCVHRRRAFIHTVTNTFPFVVSRSSIHTVCDKLWERLCHLRKRLCQTSETIVQSAWHKHAKGVARAKHTFYSSSAMLSLPSKHTYKGTLYQIVKLE